ncbi:hypothetical protein GOBAR_AA17256 [Gossypium barbadense]|uniref:Uncharacterized protein n=1 Tax=Gossypium barbadense TaxID=3634 RepID=A0A2P5XJ82_GOSBA|nr:hypothetical protein GOBAR_AA17256 [Gossypium barbadense]
MYFSICMHTSCAEENQALRRCSQNSYQCQKPASKIPRQHSKNQQASIQGLETQIGQLSKLISERSQGSLPSNTEPNPREQLNAINIQDDKGVVEPEPELMQETVVSKSQGEVDQNTNKPVNEEYKAHVPHPNATRKDRSDEQLGELTLCVRDETITLQARTSGITLNSEGNGPHQSTKIDNMTQPTLQKLSFKEVREPCSSNDRGHIHEERRLRIEELDEWRIHKPITHDKLKLRQNKPDTSPNQLKVGDRVLLDVADPHIVTTTLNEEIPLTVLNIFPFSMVEVSHPKFGTFKVNNTRLKPYLDEINSRNEDRVEVEHDFPKTRDAIKPQGRAIWPWVNLIGEHGGARGKAQFCFFDTGVRHARDVKPWTIIHGRGTLTHGHGRSEQR